MINLWRNENLLWEDDSTWSDRRASRVLLSAIAAVGTFGRSISLWRGLSDHMYQLIPSGLRNDSKFGDEEVAGDVRALLDKAEDARRRWPDAMALRGSDQLEMLALLQHLGAETPLLDLTADPLIALYFASEQADSGNHGLLVAFQIGKWEQVSLRPGTRMPDWDERISKLKEARFGASIGVFEPPNIIGRAAVQRSRLAFSPLPDSNAWSRRIGLLDVEPPRLGWSESDFERIFDDRPDRGRPSIQA